jgi:hypothetical protein
MAIPYCSDELPEPPIDTQYRIPGGWVLAWTRTEDGWQHPGEPCRQGVQCPHPWDVVGPNSVARHLTLCLPDDSAPTSLDPLWSAHEAEIKGAV